MIAWYTDNKLSYTALGLLEQELQHINKFDKFELQPSVFYGILRGAGKAMNILKHNKIDYYYVDNGYFEAKYVDRNNQKEMDGNYRVVKNDTHHVFNGSGIKYIGEVQNVLVIPPSPYSAFFHDTLPEDWLNQSMKILLNKYPNVRFSVRSKNSTRNLADDISQADAVFSFNSMSVIKAIEMCKPVTDTHGLFRKLDFHIYNYKDICNFYKPKQAQLHKIKDLIC